MLNDCRLNWYVYQDLVGLIMSCYVARWNLDLQKRKIGIVNDRDGSNSTNVERLRKAFHQMFCSFEAFFCPEFSIPTVQSAQNHIKKWWKLAWNPVSFHELMSPHATCAPFVLLCTESTCPSHFATPEALGSWSRSPPKSWEVPPQTPREIWRNRNKKRWRIVGVNVGSSD